MNPQIQDNELEFQKLLKTWIKIEDGHDAGTISNEVYNAFINKYIKEDHTHKWANNMGDEDVSVYCTVEGCNATHRV